MSILIKATCAILDIKTDNVISERIIGYYDTVSRASWEAHLQREEGETVCIYNAPVQEEEEMSAREMAELDAMWDEITNI